MDSNDVLLMLVTLMVLSAFLGSIVTVYYFDNRCRVVSNPIVKSSVPLCLHPIFNQSQNVYYCDVDDVVRVESGG